MAANGGRQRKALPIDALNLRPCLVHVPTGEVVTSYSQLSRIVKKLGWKVFIDVSGNIWSAWYLPAGEACFLQMVFLPHPHISTATYYQLTTVVQALGANTFNISYAPLRKFRELEAYSDLHKPTLRVIATGREIFTVRALTQILVQHGWRKEGENQFIKQETGERSSVNLLSVIKIPSVENLQQLSTLDLEYIALVTDNIFYIQTQSVSRFQPPRKQEGLGKPPRFPPANISSKAAENSWRTEESSWRKPLQKNAENISPQTTTENIAPHTTSEKGTPRMEAENSTSQIQLTAEKIALQTAANKTTV